jgi:addiction module RelE/StbE family toxin
MWIVYDKKTLQKDIKKAPHEVLLRYEAWKRIVELSGPQGLRIIKGFHDEGLKGQWQGFRSSRLNIKWRLIYKVEKEVFEVYVIELTPHKY